MGPAGVAAIEGGFALAGGLLGNKASADEARRNRRFQRKMYKHRYQYTVEDMRKAGLNPALAYQQGAGSSPSGSMASQEDPLSGAVEAGRRGYATALEAKMNKAQVQNVEAQTRKVQADTRLADAQANQLALESGPRARWWGQRPEMMGLQMSTQEESWRINRLTADFLDATLKDRASIVGLEREELQNILVQLKQEIDLRGLDRAPLEVRAKFARSWWGQNVAPYVSSSGAMAGAIGSILDPFLRYFSTPPKPSDTRSKTWPRYDKSKWSPESRRPQ